MIDFSEIANLDDFDPDSVDDADFGDSNFMNHDEPEFDEGDSIEIFDINKFGDIDILDSDINPVTTLDDGYYNESEQISQSHNHYRSSNIAFTGNGRCRVCNCGGWAGFGDTCANCGHFYNKHI